MRKNRQVQWFHFIATLIFIGIVILFFILSGCEVEQYNTFCSNNYDIYNYNVCKNPVKCMILSDIPKNYDDLIIKLHSDSGNKTDLKTYQLKDSLIKIDLSNLDCENYSDTLKLRISINFITIH